MIEKTQLTGHTYKLELSQFPGSHGIRILATGVHEKTPHSLGLSCKGTVMVDVQLSTDTTYNAVRWVSENICERYPNYINNVGALLPVGGTTPWAQDPGLNKKDNASRALERTVPFLSALDCGCNTIRSLTCLLLCVLFHDGLQLEV